MGLKTKESFLYVFFMLLVLFEVVYLSTSRYFFALGEDFQFWVDDEVFLFFVIFAYFCNSKHF